MTSVVPGPFRIRGAKAELHRQLDGCGTKIAEASGVSDVDEDVEGLMGVSLAKALGQGELEAGQVYRCQVKGRWIELRVLDPVAVCPSCFDASDVMLDPCNFEDGISARCGLLNPDAVRWIDDGTKNTIS
jgi:hypothetical protein